MKTIVHKIRLKRGATPEQFERWVRESDYATCPRLASVAQFFVNRVSSDPEAPYHFIEVILIDSLEAFERDMATDAFKGLVAAFEKMAEVVEELAGDRIEPGYRRQS